MSLTAELKAFVMDQGAELVGIAPVERFTGAPAGHRPEELLPGARSVVVYAFPMLEGTFLTPNPRVYVLRYYQLRLMSQDSGYRVCRFLERRGHYAINFPGTAPQSLKDKILFADFSYRHAAVLAGLGEIGWNQLLITPQFGPRVWLMAVITTAELEPDPPFQGTACLREQCNLCVAECPTKALTPGQPTSKSKCARRPNQHGLADLVEHMQAIADEKDPAKRRALIQSQTTWGIWMHTLYGGPEDRCHFCISACPVGMKKAPQASS